MSTSWPKPYHDNFESNKKQQLKENQRCHLETVMFWAQKDSLGTKYRGGWHGSDFEALKINIAMGKEADSSTAA